MNTSFKIRRRSHGIYLMLLALFAFTGQVGADQETEKPDPLIYAQGAKAWAETCSRCHNLREPSEFRDDQWRAIMSHMRVRAGLTEQETEAILKFLQESNR